MCRAMGLQQCSVCKNVQKSQCSKKACKVDGLTPVMVYVAARKDKVKKKRKRCKDVKMMTKKVMKKMKTKRQREL